MAVSPRLETAINEHDQARAGLDVARAELHAAVLAELTARQGERGAQAEIARATGYTRERIRQLTRDAERTSVA